MHVRNNSDQEEKRYPRRRRVYEIRFWGEDDLLYKIEVCGAHVNRTFVKKLISRAVGKLWNGESSLKLTIEVIYKGKDWS